MLKKGKAISPNYKIVIKNLIKVGKSNILTRKRWVRVRAWSRKTSSTLEKKDFGRRNRASEQDLPRKKNERVGLLQVSSGTSGKFWFYLANLEIRGTVDETKSPFKE